MLLNDLALVSPLPVLSVAHTHTHTLSHSHTHSRLCSLSLPLGFRHLPPQVRNKVSHLSHERRGTAVLFLTFIHKTQTSVVYPSKSFWTKHCFETSKAEERTGGGDGGGEGVGGREGGRGEEQCIFKPHTSLVMKAFFKPQDEFIFKQQEEIITATFCLQLSEMSHGWDTPSRTVWASSNRMRPGVTASTNRIELPFFCSCTLPCL